MEEVDLPRGTARYVRSRVPNACDGCKSRKVKCDGHYPCGYCAARRRSETCRYSPRRRRQNVEESYEGGRVRGQQRQQQLPRSPSLSTRGSGVSASPPSTLKTTTTGASLGGQVRSVADQKGGDGKERNSANCELSRQDGVPGVDDETEVPLEARLLRDAQGKLTFIGDCAPLSFFQSVRRLVMTKVGQSAFAPHTSGFSALENAPARHAGHGLWDGQCCPIVRQVDVRSAVSSYLCVTTSLIDLFESPERLLDDLSLWAGLQEKPHDGTSIIYFLVLAIGLQAEDEGLAQSYFEYARDQAYMTLSDSLGVETVQAFILVAVYMLCSCQINGAFLFFGIAVRAAYSIGLHRTEVNAHFGARTCVLRDRLWKSLRVVDLYLSSSMGRPPATSDVDCTVSYHTLDENGGEAFDLLDASVQILRILESVVLEIYSRRKISLQLTEGISLRLRDWSGRWLRRLKDVIAQQQQQQQQQQPVLRHIQDEAQVVGACQVLSSYFYAVMLVSRPFLMSELCRHLDEDMTPSSSGKALISGRSKLADACMDAASLMVDAILELMEGNMFRGKTPLLVSWLFASSLVLGMGLLGGFGRVFEKHTKMAIRAMNHFAERDAHARQYSLIVQSLLAAALEHLERQELRERRLRRESSCLLFGLVCETYTSTNGEPQQQQQQQQQQELVGIQSQDGSLRRDDHDGHAHEVERGQVTEATSAADATELSPFLGIVGTTFLNLSESVLQAPDDAYWNDLASNLFPLLETGGGIDLAHWFAGGPVGSPRTA